MVRAGLEQHRVEPHQPAFGSRGVCGPAMTENDRSKQRDLPELAISGRSLLKMLSRAQPSKLDSMRSGKHLSRMSAHAKQPPARTSKVQSQPALPQTGVGVRLLVLGAR